MSIWNIFRKKAADPGLKFFRVYFDEDYQFGVTASNPQEAEALVCTIIFHDQTIPGLPTVEALTRAEVKSRYGAAILKKVGQKGIWYPHLRRTAL